jgi:UDP:flavonoid glycosyltransferase YjiC (YdhE family)
MSEPTPPRRFLIVVTDAGGGDVQPLLALAAGLMARRHVVGAFVDAGVASGTLPVGVATVVADAEISLAGEYAAAAREDGHLPAEAQGERMRDRLVRWSRRVALAVDRAVEVFEPEMLAGALFGSGPVRLVAERRGLPWVAVNSTFYIGPHPPRRAELDFGPRTPLFRDFFAPNLDRATLVLHASDREFDFGFDRLPSHHRYVGPLFWDPPGDHPPYLDEPGKPWALVSLSSQSQDDLPIARASMAGLGHLPVRTLLTAGAHAGADFGPLPANARVERFVPHGPVLERAALMVSHAGHGAVMRALWHAVPMILIPWGRDQGGVATRAERLGIAAVIPKAELTPELIETTALRLLADRPLAKRAEGVSQRLRCHDPVASACSHIAEACDRQFALYRRPRPGQDPGRLPGKPNEVTIC